MIPQQQAGITTMVRLPIILRTCLIPSTAPHPGQPTFPPVTYSSLEISNCILHPKSLTQRRKAEENLQSIRNPKNAYLSRFQRGSELKCPGLMFVFHSMSESSLTWTFDVRCWTFIFFHYPVSFDCGMRISDCGIKNHHVSRFTHHSIANCGITANHK